VIIYLFSFILSTGFLLFLKEAKTAVLLRRRQQTIVALAKLNVSVVLFSSNTIDDTKSAKPTLGFGTSPKRNV
jgi:hypothetical protein